MIFMKFRQTLLHILLALVSADNNAERQTQNVVDLENMIPKKEFSFFGTLKIHNLNI